MNIADIGKRHLKDALTKKLSNCEVTEWEDGEGNPVKIYWEPLTGAQQKQIEEAGTDVDRQCMAVKVRALNKDRSPIFSDTPLASLTHDYDFNVIRAIAFLMATDMGQDNQEEIEEEIEKE